MSTDPSRELPATLVDELLAARAHHCFPPRLHSTAKRFISGVLELLFPHFADEVSATRDALGREIERVESDLRNLCESLSPHDPGIPRGIPRQFMEKLPAIYQALRLDAQAIEQGDPAARSIDEVILTYPGVHAIAIYRVANALHRLGFPLVPRLLTEIAHRRTGVDIHPGATIGRRFVIDHGTGVVIGETTVIGDGVKLYQGVTLGALTVEKALANKKRHPTLEDHVVVYSNATILGGDTVIGHDSVIGGNAWLTQSVPAFSAVSRRSEVRPRTGNDEFADLDFII